MPRCLHFPIFHQAYAISDSMTMAFQNISRDAMSTPSSGDTQPDARKRFVLRALAAFEITIYHFRPPPRHLRRRAAADIASLDAIIFAIDAADRPAAPRF
jgi:hypothetical protein